MSKQFEDFIRVMIVDDSAVIRNIVSRVFEKNPGFKVAATADNGENAVKKLRDHPVDVVILDIDMPVLDGMKAIPLLKSIDPAVQIIMASTLTSKNAEISLRALELGATDYIPKPSAGREPAASLDFAMELLEKVKVLGALARDKGVRLTAGRAASAVTRSALSVDEFVPEAKKKFTLRQAAVLRPHIIAVGASTGGPEALLKLIRHLGSGLPQPILITQHMPPTFTVVLAERISQQCNVVCREAKDGEMLLPGQYYLAPGDFHMLVVKGVDGPAIKLVQDPRENFCRPAVDPMLRSLPAIYGGRALVVMLTGMGFDGTKGSEVIVAAGGNVIAQNEATSVVWGMPGSVALAGLCSAVLPIDELAATVRIAATRTII